jgi:hypothetical protein
MSGVATAVVVGSVAGAYITSQGQQNAAQTQADAARANQQNLLAAGQTASQEFAPYATYGTTPLSSLTANNDYFNRQFSNTDLNTNLAPNFAFGLDIGQRSNLMANNATGGVVGGNTLKSLSDYSQNYAQNAYQNAFTNYTNQKNSIAGIDLANATLGLSGATGKANAQLGTATNVANIGLGAANAQAASQIAQGNTWGGVANTAGNLAGYSMLNNMNQPMNADAIAAGASPGGAFTPTAGNSFIINPA